MEKSAVVTGTVIMNSLHGLVVDDVITDDEYKVILDRFGQASKLDESSINQAVEGVGNGDYVASVLRKQLLQQNVGPSPAPKPTVPIQQPAVSANLESQVNMISAPYPTVDMQPDVAQLGFSPGSEPGLKEEDMGGLITDKLAEAALNKLLTELKEESEG